MIKVIIKKTGIATFIDEDTFIKREYNIKTTLLPKALLDATIEKIIENARNGITVHNTDTFSLEIEKTNDMVDLFR